MVNADLDRLGFVKKTQPKLVKKSLWPVIVVLLAMLGMLLLILNEASAEVVDLNTIRTIESAGNPNAVSRTGAIGLYQIMPCVLREYSLFNKVNYSRTDLFNPLVNEQIAKWYLTKRIPQMLRHYKKEVNLANLITAYNAGIRAVIKGYMPKETRNYLAKYQRLARVK